MGNTPTGADRERLRRTFESAAHLYHRARPDYPDALVDDLLTLTGITPGDHLVEIGCATGKATLALARRGFAVTGLEIGPALAAEGRANLAAFPGVRIVEVPFEHWRPDEPAALVYAATSWHWVDPAVRYRRAWEALRPGGHLAFWSATHVFPDGGDPFTRDLQEVYERIGEGMGDDAAYPRPGELPDARAEIEATGLFTDVVVRHHDWEVTYDADAYVALLDTFSGHIAMSPGQREVLYGEIRRRLAARPHGTMRRGWGAVLHVARRVDG